MTDEEAALHAAQQVGHLYTFLTIVAIVGLTLIAMAFFGSLTGRQAIKRGHLPRSWFWIGFFLPVFGLIALFVVKPGPGAQKHRENWFRAVFSREQVWETANLRGVSRRRAGINVAVAVVAGITGLLVGRAMTGWGWGVFWGIVAAIAASAVLMVIAILADRLPEQEPGYTPSEKRPPEPRKVVTLVWPLLIMIVAFWLGGLFGDLLGGVIWGAIGAAGVIAALYLAKEQPSTVDMGIIAAGIIASAVLARFVLPDLPEDMTANLALRMAAAWLPAGAAAAAVIWRRYSIPAKAATAVIGWGFAGLIALPAALSFEILKPLSSWVGEPDAFSTTNYAWIGITVALVGGAFLLAGLTGLNSLVSATTVLYLTGYAGAQVGFTIPGLIENFTNLSEVAKQMWPPDFEWAIGTGDWWNIASWDFGSELRANPLIETFRIAIIACLIGVTVAVPLALRASRVTAIRGSDYWLNKGIMNVIRTVPDLFWAMIFATSVGIGPFAGTLALIFFSMAIMAKLLSETVDAVDPRPIEAARATGSHHWPAMRTSVWPQVLPNYVAYALYIFEINIRASVVLGIVGAGGIGRVLEAQRAFFRFDRVLAIVLVIFVIVFLIEQVSVALRRRLV